MDWMVESRNSIIFGCKLDIAEAWLVVSTFRNTSLRIKNHVSVEHFAELAEVAEQVVWLSADYLCST